MKKLFLVLILMTSWQLKAGCISSFNNAFKREFEPQNIFSYCECVKDKKVLNWLEKSFQNKEKILRKKDLCALSHFSSYELNFFYHIKRKQYLIPFVSTSIETYYLKNIQAMPGWYEKEQCIKEKVQSVCFKGKSMETSYHCIKEEVKKEHICIEKDLKI